MEAILTFGLILGVEMCPWRANSALFNICNGQECSQ